MFFPFSSFFFSPTCLCFLFILFPHTPVSLSVCLPFFHSDCSCLSFCLSVPLLSVSECVCVSVLHILFVRHVCLHFYCRLQERTLSIISLFLFLPSSLHFLLFHPFIFSLSPSFFIFLSSLSPSLLSFFFLSYLHSLLTFSLLS